MKSNVTVKAQEGKVITPNANAAKDGRQFGYIVVEQNSLELNSKGFLAAKVRSALIKGEVKHLEMLGLNAGQALGGRIFITESTIAPFEGAEAKINPETKETLTKDGSPIYREAQYDPSGKIEDTLLVSDQALARVSTPAIATAASAEGMK